jgi:hypothetical protein
VRADVLKHLQPSFRGKVWLFYTDRIDYWRYSSVTHEGELLRATLQAAGCRVVGDQPFTNMRVDALDCAHR